MVKLAKFSTLEEAENKLQEFNDIVVTASSTQPFNLTQINFSGEFYWFSFSDCIANAGIAYEQIVELESTMNIHEFELIPSDWQVQLENLPI